MIVYALVELVAQTKKKKEIEIERWSRGRSVMRGFDWRDGGGRVLDGGWLKEQSMVVWD